jgi:hypothetical protein
MKKRCDPRYRIKKMFFLTKKLFEIEKEIKKRCLFCVKYFIDRKYFQCHKIHIEKILIL